MTIMHVKSVILLVLWLATASAWSQPQISNVNAAQRTDGSALVDITYDVAGGEEPMTVSVLLSNDNGETWTIRPSYSALSGDVGPGVTNGSGKRVIWDAGSDRPGVRWEQAGVKITARDKEPDPPINLPLPGGVTLELVFIPRGEFQMSSPADERGHHPNEDSLHPVTIDYDFYMGATEVTQAQWEAVMGSNPAQDYGVGPNRPIYNVSWNDVAGPGGFLDQVNIHLLSVGKAAGGLSLPSEAEWEYACRAGTQTRFFFGDSLDCEDNDEDCAAGVLPGNRTDYMWYEGNRNPRDITTRIVGTKLPNPWGLYDMHGNISEWCQDWFHSYAGAPADGSARETPVGTLRVSRSGEFYSRADQVRSAYRGAAKPDYAGVKGFRVVLR